MLVSFEAYIHWKVKSLLIKIESIITTRKKYHFINAWNATYELITTLEYYLYVLHWKKWEEEIRLFYWKVYQRSDHHWNYYNYLW